MQLTASAEGTDSLTVDAVATPTKKEVSGSSENSFETIEEQEADCKWNRLLYLSAPQMSDNMYKLEWVPIVLKTTYTIMYV